MKITYIAVFEFADDGINITFPDVPNAISCAYNYNEAVEMAKEALELTLHGEKITSLPESKMEVLDDKECLKYVPITIEINIKNGFLYSDNVYDIKGNNDSNNADNTENVSSYDQN